MPKNEFEKALESERRALSKDLAKEMSQDTRKLYLEMLQIEAEAKEMNKNLKEFIEATKAYVAMVKESSNE